MNFDKNKNTFKLDSLSNTMNIMEYYFHNN